MKTETEKLLQKHEQLTNTDMAKVESHVQRKQDDWILNTVIIEGYDVDQFHNFEHRGDTFKMLARSLPTK